MPRSIFLSCVFENSKHRDDVVRWVKEGKLGKDIVAITEREDRRVQGEAAIVNHLKPLINGSAAVVMLVGQDTHNHEWVRYEAKVATSLNKKIILARIPGTTGAVPEDFKHLPIVALDPNSLAKALSQG
jgi:hypothetical protein